MLQIWNDDMIRFMRDASEYGTYHRALAQHLAPILDPGMHVCDAGCGLGYLSLALSPYVDRITAVEKNPDALAVLEQNCRRRNIDNITARCSPLADAAPVQPYDAMIFCFFGGIDEILTAVETQCRGSAVIITRNYTTHRFSVGSHPTGSYGYGTASARLRELGIPFAEETLALEYGQPLRSLPEARRFYEVYSQDVDKTAITDEFLRTKLVETGRADYPLYLPHRRNLAILRFDRADIPEART